MQVNLPGSPCFPGVFLYCFGHRKKRNLATRVHENTPFDPKISKKFSGEEALPPSQTTPPLGRGTPSPHTPPPLAPSAPRLGSRLRARPWPPSSTSGSAYELGWGDKLFCKRLEVWESREVSCQQGRWRKAGRERCWCILALKHFSNAEHKTNFINSVYFNHYFSTLKRNHSCPRPKLLVARHSWIKT